MGVMVKNKVAIFYGPRCRTSETYKLYIDRAIREF